MKVLSLYDGMSCGMIAFRELGIPIEEYHAYEIDKFAVQTSQHNFPEIIHHGDVFEGDFTEYKGFDWLIGGSPCTYWSIAQKNNRETEASGIGWELFSQYVRALKEAQPKWFLYENNKSMSNAIRASITETFGFEPVCINSALVSAQNRQRLYWVGRRNENGTYDRVYVEQPEDRGILLKDILEGGHDLSCNDKSFALTASYDGAVPQNTIERHQRNMVAEPVKCFTLPRQDGVQTKSKQYRVYDTEGKATTLCAEGGGMGAKTGLYAVCVAQRGRYTDSGNRHTKGNGPVEQYYEARVDNKTNAITTVQKDNNVAIPVCINSKDVDGKQPSVADRIYDKNGKAVTVTSGWIQNVTEPVFELCDLKFRGGSHIVVNEHCIRGVQDKNGANCSENVYQFTDRKGYTMITAHTPTIIDSLDKYKGYAEPCEWDSNGRPTKAISYADGKTYTVYSVKDGQITIKDKTYPIKLVDGYYIIRKLTVRECMRLQTVPEWYEFLVSNAQAYKMLGNGWTVEVIKHLITSALTFEPSEFTQTEDRQLGFNFDYIKE